MEKCFISAVKKPARHLKRRVFLSTVNSILAGMVAVAAGAVSYNPWSAIVVGFIAAFSFLGWSKLLTKLHIDDPVETAAGQYKNLSNFVFDDHSIFFVNVYQFILVAVYGVFLHFQSFDEQLDQMLTALSLRIHSTRLFIELLLEKAGG